MIDSLSFQYGELVRDANSVTDRDTYVSYARHDGGAMLPRFAAITLYTLGLVVIVYVSSSKRIAEHVRMSTVQLAQTSYDGG